MLVNHTLKIGRTKDLYNVKMALGEEPLATVLMKPKMQLALATIEGGVCPPAELCIYCETQILI